MVKTRQHLGRAAVPLAVWAVFSMAPEVVRAGDDYDPESREWNGLSELVAIGEGLGIDVRVSDRLDVGTLSPIDAVMIVYPRNDLPLSGIAAFLRDGGRLALLDDFGRGDELLGVYQIGRVQARLPAAAHVRQNENLPIAPATARHTLTEGVTALVANHPTTLSHDELDALFAFDGVGHALVLAGAVGDGRLVAIGDPSIAINNMLEFRDNRRFVENLFRYLEAGAGGTVHVVAADAIMVGRYGEPGADRPFHDLSRWLTDVAHAEAPPLAVLVGAIALSAILLVVAATSLPRRSPYDGSHMFARPPASGGFVGRVGYFSRNRHDLFSPTMAYKFELEGELVRLLDLRGGTVLGDVVRALSLRGLSAAEIDDARALLVELSDLRERQDRPPGPPRVPLRRFRSLLARGEQLLARLEPEGHPGV
jgi:hypothetical protein